MMSMWGYSSVRVRMQVRKDRCKNNSSFKMMEYAQHMAGEVLAELVIYQEVQLCLQVKLKQPYRMSITHWCRVVRGEGEHAK